MSGVFVDTSALIALLDRTDPRRPAVTATFAANRQAALATHGYVVAESLAVARRRFGAAGELALLDDVLPAIAVIPVDTELHDRAIGAHRAALPSSISFVDRVSLALIAREGFRSVIALDPDLATPGAPVLPAATQVSDPEESGRS